MNQHKVGPDQLGLVAKLHLNKKCIKLAKKVKIGTQKKVKNCHKKPMKRSSLKKRFEDAICHEGRVFWDGCLLKTSDGRQSRLSHV